MSASYHTPDGLARLSAAAKATFSRPEVAKRWRAALVAKTQWTDETQAQVRAWAEEGVSIKEMGRRLGVSFDTVKGRATRYGIDLLGPERARVQAAEAVLRQHYETDMPHAELLRLYGEARGESLTREAMQQHARKLNLHRPVGNSRSVAGSVRAAHLRAERDALAPRIQALLDERQTVDAIMATVRVSSSRLQLMIRRGEVVRPPPLPIVPKPRVARVRKAKAPKVVVPKPRKLPKSWVRVAQPAAPKPVYETVEQFLSSGGRITHCPAAAAHVTTADLGEGRDVIRRHAAVMAGDDGNWVARAKRKIGRFHFKAAR